MIAGVVLDDWKLTIFKRHLDVSGYRYTEHPGPAKHMKVLKVTCDSARALQRILEAAANECALSKMH